MNILIFYQYFGTPKGSWSTRFYEFARRWVAAGNKVTVVTAPYEKSDIKASKFIDTQKIDGIDIIIINTPDSNRKSVMKRGLNAILFSICSSWYAVINNANVVIASSGPITIGLPGLFAKIFRRRILVFETRDLWPGGGIEMGKIKHPLLIWAALRLEKVLYKSASLVVSCSRGQMENIQERFPEVKCVAIPHGGDLELFAPNGSSPVQNSKVFIHLGSLGFIHNCKLILEAALVLKKIGKSEGITILFIGDGAERKKLEEQKKKYGLDNIQFMGLLPKIELPKYVQDATALLFTTLNNRIQNTSCPNKIFDAFAAGIPIIQTTTGWIKDLIEQEKCGLNVTPDDANELANAIVLLAENPKMRQTLSENATRVATDLFNRDTLAQEYLNELKALVN